MFLCQISRCLCLKLQNVFVSNCKMYLPQITKCNCQMMRRKGERGACRETLNGAGEDSVSCLCLCLCLFLCLCLCFSSLQMMRRWGKVLERHSMVREKIVSGAAAGGTPKVFAIFFEIYIFQSFLQYFSEYIFSDR